MNHKNARLIAVAARGVAKDIAEGTLDPGRGRTFGPDGVTPCCSMGHIFARAGLTEETNALGVHAAARKVLGLKVFEQLDKKADNIIDRIVASNDNPSRYADKLAERMVGLAEALEARVREEEPISV